MKQTTNTKKLALAGVLTALAIVGSFLSFPVAGSKCAPVQHMVNIFAAVLLGPGWGVGIAFCASLLRNILGIGSLIYQLPIPLCKMFIREIFDNKSPDDFDEETLVTIDKFFENSLNVSETSRQLYIHRNTLVYRLDKLQKSTGLDLRVFEDAFTFKIALMVVRYMKYMETLEY